MFIEWIFNVLNYQIYGDFLWQYILFVIIVIATFFIGKIINYIIKTVVHVIASRTKTKLDDMIVEATSPPIILFVSILGFYIGYNTLTLSETALKYFGGATKLFTLIGVAWLIMRFIDSLVKYYLLPFTAKTESDLDDHLLPIVRKILNIIIVVIFGLMILDEFGFNITSLLAGVGIGGLAFALAAKDIIANLFGGFTVFTDKPFKVGDRIKIDKYDGNVETIDIRSTKIRTTEGRLVTVPNAKFAEGFIENVTVEPNRKIIMALGLTYNTTPEKLDKAIKIVDEIIRGHKNIQKNDITVFFENFGDFSLQIKVIYYILHNNSWETIYKTQHDINTEILKRFNKEKLSFAFPTQTIELMKAK